MRGFPMYILGLLLIGSHLRAQQKMFELVPSTTTGISFSNMVPSYEQMNVLVSQYHYNGAGVAIGDINNDDLPDIFLNANFGPDKLYLNKGDFQFEDISASAGIEGKMSWETGVSMADINNDGFLDLFVSRSGHAPGAPYYNLIYINNGDLTFTENALDYLLFDVSHSTQNYFLDYDRDGDLDLYLLNHNPQRTWQYDFTKPELTRDNQVGDKLFRNDDGHFTDVSTEAGIIGKSISYGLGALIGDINNDLWPDIYICNDFGERDYLYINNGDGTFRENLQKSMQHISWYSMGGDIADINNDGLLDYMVLDMTAADHYRQKTNMNDMNPEKFWYAVSSGLHYQYMINTMQLNVGHETFSEIAYLAGLAYTDWSWGPLFGDFDLDGYKDLFVSNGYRVDISDKDYRIWLEHRQKELNAMDQSQRNIASELQEALTKLDKTQVPNYIFKNNGDLTFSDVSTKWGFDSPSFSNGVAYGDLDGDGDLDLVVNNLDHEAFIYRNLARDLHPDRQFIKIDLDGPAGNVDGIGARVELKTDEGVLMQENYSVRGFQSSVEPIMHFGLGHLDVIEAKVLWHDGSVTVAPHPDVNQTLSMAYTDRIVASAVKPDDAPLFHEVTDELAVDFHHVENEFDDFEREVLLPHKMSRWGPALAVADVDGDGYDDFFIGGAAGQAGALYKSDKDSFEKIASALWEQDKSYEDIDAEFFDLEGDGDLDLYVVSGGYHMEPGAAILRDRIYINDGRGTFTPGGEDLVPEMYVSGGVVRAGDFDGDGDSDLFVGGRVVPGRYPEAPRSALLENVQGKFVDVTEKKASMLLHPGLVTDASWQDIDGDDLLDLVLVGEWMYPMFLLNRGDQFRSQNQFEDKRGWWFSVTPKDLDGDGDVDFILGNLGKNYKYKASADKPFEIYVNDFDTSGTLDIVLGYYDQEQLVPVRGRQCSSEQMPFIKAKFETYDAFAKADIFEIYGEDRLNKSLHYQATTFESMVALNDGKGKFSLEVLPNLAQTAPINDALIHDFTGDGSVDIFVAGNLYNAEVETPRADAGKGWLLRNNNGALTVIPPVEVGVIADSDVKRMAVLNKDNDPIIVIASNNGRMTLYRLNQR